MLAVASQICAWRIEVRITEPIIDGGKTGRAAITEIRDLHGRRLAGENQQAIAAHVQGEIDQNIDLVFPHGVGEFFVAKTRGHPPDVRDGTKPSVKASDCGVSE